MTTPVLRRLRAVGMATACVGAVATCATNPATGARQLVLISEQREIQMGREADPQVVRSMGLYDDPQLATYVQHIGERVAAVTERPNLPWTFRVIDDPVVNAFAIPGGFIYVTRGILAHFNSEAQLVAVLGHEAGHVTARHSVEQMSRAQLAQVGLVAGAIFAPERFQGLVGVANAGMQLMFLKFSRDDESQADALGFRYMLRLNYDPRQMADVFTMLDRVSQAQSGGRIPEWLSTHPNPVNRRERVEQEIDSLGRSVSGLTVNGPSYVARLSGLVYGDDPRQGFFEGGRFLHPELRFQFQFPTGWKTLNQHQAVAGASPNQDALLQLTLAEQSSADAAAQAFAGQQGVLVAGRQRTTMAGLPAVLQEFQAEGNNTQLAGVGAFIEYGGNVYQILGYAAAAAWSGYRNTVLQSVRSFDRLTDPRALNVKPQRLAIVTLDRAMTLQEFASRYPSVVSLDELALLNQAEATTRFAAGTELKRVTQ